ncbi:FecCD family ABC transporter permease [Acetivibrio cellulolyticus]|uniref:FecCD family ABC transporter permease n=1 Tax=Acetivibrio cellulolyticus TaxID=35830 RepID=UPI0001E2E6F3|nr:iron ABC transporter permease [Acetivibrio cellulolyticus]
MKNVFNNRKINNSLRVNNFKSIVSVVYIVLIISLFSQLLTGCKVQTKEASTITYYYSFVDSLNNEVNLKDKPQRVISLARSLGLNAARLRFIYLILAAILAGSAISFAGLLGFVGLIVPHAARLLVGYDNRILLPASALLGGIFTLLCDLLARVIFAPYEIPVGIIMSFLGGPFFIYLLIKGKRGLLYD